jgi:hypothetical protein
MVPKGHAAQVLPCRPQALGRVPIWQTPFWQQPPQLKGPHDGGVQAPFAQLQPNGHDVHTWPPPPHWAGPWSAGGMQTPPWQQPLHVCALQLGVTHWPLPHICPGMHVVHC